jgi:hypothetical protein
VINFAQTRGEGLCYLTGRFGYLRGNHDQKRCAAWYCDDESRVRLCSSGGRRFCFDDFADLQSPISNFAAGSKHSSLRDSFTWCDTNIFGDHVAHSKRTEEKIGQPEVHYQSPNDIVHDHALSHDEKKDALSTWEQDARQLLTASNEGMSGSEEGVDKHNHHRLGEIVRAKAKIGEHLKDKPSH